MPFKTQLTAPTYRVKAGGALTALIATAMAVSSASPTLAQSFDNATGTGNILPMVYDAQGGKHRFTYGYYGPPTPPLVPGGDDKFTVGRNNVQITDMFLRTQQDYNFKPIRRSRAVAASYARRHDARIKLNTVVKGRIAS